MKAVIFAGGKGKRLMPLTNTIPKPMMPISGKPLLVWTIEALERAGVKDILILVGHLKEDIMNYFGKGDRFGVRIKYVEQKEQLGTADALRYTKKFIGKDKRFLLLYGDIVFDNDLIQGLMSSIYSNNNFICSWRVDNPEIFGTFELINDKIIRIHEKSENPPSNLINTGIYLLPNEIFNAVEKTLPSKRNEYELTDSIQILIDEGHEFLHYPIKGFWSDVGDITILNNIQGVFKCVE